MQCPYCKEEIVDDAVKCKHCGSNVGVGIAKTLPSAQGDDFAVQFTAAFNIWKNNLTDMIVLTLVFMLVAWIPIANIGFIAGYTRSLIKVSRGEGKAQVADIFNAWDCFGNLFVYLLLYVIASIVLHFVPVVGSLASIALGFLAAPGIYAVIDRNMGAIDAYKWGIETIQAAFVPWLLAYLVGTAIIFAGFMLLVIGALFSMPFGSIITIQQYNRVRPA